MNCFEYQYKPRGWPKPATFRLVTADEVAHVEQRFASNDLRYWVELNESFLITEEVLEVGQSLAYEQVTAGCYRQF
jgi:hypothetical protein